MGFFEKFGDKLTSTSKDVTQRAKEFSVIAKLNSAISKENSKMKELYSTLGQLYYNNNKDDATEEYGLIVKNINESVNTVNELTAKIEQIKVEGEKARNADRKVCANCGAVLKDDAAFCTACGAKYEPPVVATVEPGVQETPAQTGTPVVEEPAANKCPNCGADLLDGAAFCVKCGTRVNE